jgi:hypothetical protein
VGSSLCWIANLAGANGEKAQAIIRALDPVALPIFLELGSICFMSAAFGKGRQRRKSVNRSCSCECHEIDQSVWQWKAMPLKDIISLSR